MSKCVVCGFGEAVVPDRENPSIRVKKVCKRCHAARLLEDLDKIFAIEKRRRLAWERR